MSGSPVLEPLIDPVYKNVDCYVWAALKVADLASHWMRSIARSSSIGPRRLVGVFAFKRPRGPLPIVPVNSPRYHLCH